MFQYFEFSTEYKKDTDIHFRVLIVKSIESRIPTNEHLLLTVEEIDLLQPFESFLAELLLRELSSLLGFDFLEIWFVGALRC